MMWKKSIKPFFEQGNPHPVEIGLKIEELFLKEFDNGIYFSGKLVIVFHVLFDFVDRVKDSGMMFSPEFIPDVIEWCFG